MNITSKSRYALKIMIDLAEQEEGGSALTHRVDVATRQGIPLEYMDQILSRLREAGLVVSTRGRRGGYQLGQRADQISMLEIFRTVEDAWQPVACLDAGGGAGACRAEHVCSTRDTWSLISGAIGTSLSGILLSDVLTRKVPQVHPFPGAEAAATPASESLAGHLQECRAPRRRSLAAATPQIPMGRAEAEGAKP